MYYAITRQGVISGRALSDVNKKLNANIEISEFTACGADFICSLTDDDISFVQDKKRVGQIMMSNLFKKTDKNALFLYIIIGLQLLLLLKG